MVPGNTSGLSFARSIYFVAIKSNLLSDENMRYLLRPAVLIVAVEKGEQCKGNAKKQ